MCRLVQIFVKKLFVVVKEIFIIQPVIDYLQSKIVNTGCRKKEWDGNKRMDWDVWD